MACKGVSIYQNKVSWVRGCAKFIFEGSCIGFDLKTLFKVYRVWYQIKGYLISNRVYENTSVKSYAW